MNEIELPTTPAGGLPVSPNLATEFSAEFPEQRAATLDRRVWFISALAVFLALLATGASQLLLTLISLFTNLCFFGRWSIADASPAANHLGLFVIVVPIGGGLVVGMMARYGSKAIRGHGIPEAMEQVLTNESRVPARLTLLKPLSSAVAIGTGGPFGAEGPIIATGGALGSLLGQLVATTAAERKTLLAAGAAAGMTATFGTPFSAVLLAVELLLFEYRPQSLIPVALATVVAAGGRIWLEGAEPVFEMPPVATVGLIAGVCYLFMGVAFGCAAVVVTRAAYWVEDAFERLPVHWMWWPALGGLAVGTVGYFTPRTLGVGYDNLHDLLDGSFTLRAALVLGTMKLLSWSISLGSGTSGGTLAPLLTVGGCLGSALAFGIAQFAPGAAIDPRLAALVGMASLFAGASRAPLASALFALEVTHQSHAALPLLGGCAVAYLVSCRLMRNSIMTEKIARRGISAPTEYVADVLTQVLVRDVATPAPITFSAEETVATGQKRLASDLRAASHQGFPIVDANGAVVGVLTRNELLQCTSSNQPLRNILRRTPIVVYDDCNVRDAAEHMLRHNVGRLPVVRRDKTKALVGILTRSDVLAALARHVQPRASRRTAS